MLLLLFLFPAEGHATKSGRQTIMAAVERSELVTALDENTSVSWSASSWLYITGFPRRRPFVTALITGTAKTTLADIVVQITERKPRFDLRRICVFTAFGFLFQGLFLYFVYICVWTHLAPRAAVFADLSLTEKLADRDGQIDLIKQVCLDNFVIIPFFFFPTFHTLKEVIQGGDKPEDGTSQSGSVLRPAMARYRRSAPVDLPIFWLMWIPIDITIYSFPLWMRLPLNHFFSFLSTGILSFLRGAEVTHR